MAGWERSAGVLRRTDFQDMADLRLVLPLAAAAAVGGFFVARGLPVDSGSGGGVTVHGSSPAGSDARRDDQPDSEPREGGESIPRPVDATSSSLGAQDLIDLYRTALDTTDARGASLALRTLVDRFPDEAGSYGASLTGENDAAVHAMVERLAESDPAAASRWIHAHLQGADARDRAWGVLFDAMGNADLASRTAVLETITDVFEHEPAVRAALESIRPDQAGAAIDWISGDPLLSDPGSVLIDLARGWGRTAYDAVAAAVGSRVADPVVREQMLANAIEGLGAAHPERLVAIVPQLPEGIMRDQLLNAAILPTFESDRSAALELLESYSDGDVAVAAAESVAEAWAEQSPRDAADWAADLIQRGVPAGALRRVLRSWVEGDRVAACAWVAGTPPGAVRDNGAEALAVVLASSDPAEAFRWTSEIGAARLRESAQREIARVLWESSPDSARPVLRAAGLPPAVLESIDPSLLLDLDDAW